MKTVECEWHGSCFIESEVNITHKMPQTPTFKELVDFVFLNKKDKTFMGLSDERIVSMLWEGVQQNSLYYAVDHDNKITGMILAIADEKQKILFITENLAMSIATLKVFARKAKEQFQGYKLEAMRHGAHRKFNTEKLFNKL